METERRVFSRILKNDFGRGGAWDFYWGAFYPKGGKRTEGAQLSLWINHERLEFGFYIGAYGSAQRQRFQRNCEEHYEALVQLLGDLLADDSLVYGRHEDVELGPDGRAFNRLGLDWKGWLRDPEQGNFDASVALTKKRVLQSTREQLCAGIVETYARIFPLVLLATLDDPLPTIGEYLGITDVEPELQPIYTLAECAHDTGFDEETLQRWVRAVERKGQAIFYEPPGTGKTYVAEHLARHLVGGTDGFWDLVQFHPAYAYEDFVQGIRPQPQKGGGLHYPMVPGRFLDFCTEARTRQGTCVLIIDEINRANLARVLGELMYLLEYRDREVPLAGGGTLRIPKNVRLIGTMNTADRSIALVDHALRRRFAFLGLQPNLLVLERYHQQTGFPIGKLVEVLKQLNGQIGDAHYQVGISFFLHKDLAAQLGDIWQMEIEPYLEEYFFDQPDKVDQFRWKKVQGQVLP
ncbi:MAG: AAA family ATPase [Anaerolineae bacterium]|nr:AAA family ATPase [Anaerolineae bacterium]